MNKRRITICCFITLIICLVYSLTKIFPHGENFSKNDEKSESLILCDPENYVVRQGDGSQIDRLPLLNEIEWPTERFSETPVLDNLIKAELFEPRMSRGQRRTHQNLIVKFASIMRTHHIESEWFLDSGSLLGSIRHHDLIPYDDDVDVGANKKYRQIIRQAIIQTDGEYLFADMKTFDKMYMKLVDPPNNTQDLEGSRKVPNYQFGWPCLDIIYFTKVMNTIHFEFQSRTQDWNETFPLVYRPYGSDWFPTPRRPIAYSRRIFSNFMFCNTGGYSHAREASFKPVQQSCSTLRYRYPFVRRRQLRKTAEIMVGDQLQCIIEDLVLDFMNLTSQCIQSVITAVSTKEAFEQMYS